MKAQKTVCLYRRARDVVAGMAAVELVHLKRCGTLDLISFNVFVGWSACDVANEEFLYLNPVLIPFKIVVDRALSIFITSYPRFRSVCAALQSFPCCLLSRYVQHVKELGGTWTKILVEEAAPKSLN